MTVEVSDPAWSGWDPRSFLWHTLPPTNDPEAAWVSNIPLFRLT